MMGFINTSLLERANVCAGLWCRKPAFQSSPHVYACALLMHKILVVLRGETTSLFEPVLPAAPPKQSQHLFRLLQNIATMVI